MCNQFDDDGYNMLLEILQSMMEMDVINLQALMTQYDLQINDMVVAKQNQWYAKQNQTKADDKFQTMMQSWWCSVNVKLL